MRAVFARHTMRYFALICDYDGTLAQDGVVAKSTIDALKKVRASGRKLILATGRQLPDLTEVFPDLCLFDRVVAENGGVLYRPAQRERRCLTRSTSAELVEKLRTKAVAPIAVGETIVSTWVPNEKQALEAIQELGLDLQITFNKGAVMILPSGVNKGYGVRAALAELSLSPHNSVGVGDAENDHGFLEICECCAAVANALPALKERVDFVTQAARGLGVEELIEKLLTNDLADFESRLLRHQIALGSEPGGMEFRLQPYGKRLLVAGPSGSGKSTFTNLVIEQLLEKGYQVCVIDPEGDHGESKSLVMLGGSDHKPEVSEILEVLDTHEHSLVINMLGVSIEDRPEFFQKVLASLQELRARTGRPQWIIIDEAHHVLPASTDAASLVIPLELSSAAFVTIHPNHLSGAILDSINGIVISGQEPRQVLADFNQRAATRLDADRVNAEPIGQGELIVWLFGENRDPERLRLAQTLGQRRRHKQKYAMGELGEDKSFYFRGPEFKLNLRAQNLNLFAQIASGVDESTWEHHLRAHDYSTWLRDSVKDPALADAVAEIETEKDLRPAESRQKLLALIREHYTAGA